jgi:hypothetical protein
MIKTQCEQIAETQSLILKQANFNNIAPTNMFSRGGTETRGSRGPD